MNAELRDRLRQIVFAHTVAGSKHQHAALDIVDKNLQRYYPRIETIQCHECKRSFEGVTWTRPEPEGPAPTYSQISEIVDTWGFIALAPIAACAACMLNADPGSHFKCHRCLGEGYISDIYDPKKKKDEPLLIDVLYRQTFKKHGHNETLRGVLQRARRFVLDDPMTEFLYELTYTAFHGPRMIDSEQKVRWKKVYRRLDETRHFSRLPHDTTWVDLSREAALRTMAQIKEREKLNYVDMASSRGEPKPEDWEGSGQRIGWLMTQHPKIETAFLCTQFYNVHKDNPAVECLPTALCWQTDDDPLPWQTWEPQSEYRGLKAGSEIATGIHGYTRSNVGFHIMDRDKHEKRFSRAEIAQEYENSIIDSKGTLRYIWMFLSTINKIPLVGQHEVKPSHGFVAKGRYRHFLSHQVITLHVPEKAKHKIITKVIGELRRRAHQVRGHWRDDWRLPKGNKSLWIAEHQRGDASIGFVTHDYSVEHEHK